MTDAANLKRSCYNCRNLRLCKLYSAVNDAIKSNIDMIEVNEPASSYKSFVHVHTAVAAACSMFEQAAAIEPVRMRA